MIRYVFTCCILSLFACARPVAPQGGPKDTTPPSVVPEKSSPNLSTRFQDREFYLSFDEWVTLKDVGTQVLISPPLAKRPEVTLKGSTVTLKFDEAEVLRPNTTYTINFGTAVKDLHEGNPAKDLRFVFSTGDFIDSLSVTGIVLNALTGEPLDNMAVMLYDVSEDSVVQKERPYYLARSDKSGQFSIQNVRAGRFKCVAIEDVNQNLKWDGETEQIGFPDSLLNINDSLSTLAAIRVYKPKPKLRMVKQDAKRYGIIKLQFNGLADSLATKADLANLQLVRFQDLDTLLIWYDQPDSVAWNLLVDEDTVLVKALSRNAFLNKHTLTFRDERAAPTVASQQRRGRQAAPSNAPPAAAPPPRRTKLVNVNPNKPVLLPFNSPVNSIDTSKCSLIADSIETRAFALLPDSTDPRAAQLVIDWQDGQRYALQLFPGAVTDFYGTSNTDTLRRNFAAPVEKQLGTLNLTVDSLQIGEAYVLRLLKGNTLESERFFVADSASIRFTFPKLQPVAYNIQLIEDQNNNQRWDPGSYYARRQPERIFIKKLDPLRANWEVEASILAKVDSGRRGG